MQYAPTIPRHNPFKYTDPSGEGWLGVIIDFIIGIFKGKDTDPPLFGISNDYWSHHITYPDGYVEDGLDDVGTESGGGSCSGGGAAGTPTQHPLGPLELQNLYFEKVNKELEEKRTTRVINSDPSTKKVGNEEAIQFHKGKLTYLDAKFHYMFGQGSPVAIDLNSIDLSFVRQSDFVKGELQLNLVFHPSEADIDDALVHGTINLVLENGYARIARIESQNDPLYNQRAGMFNFEMHKPINKNEKLRNFFTRALNGVTIMGPVSIFGTPAIGTAFPIYYYGRVKIKR